MIDKTIDGVNIVDGFTQYNPQHRLSIQQLI